jgi:hypothetical protein
MICCKDFEDALNKLHIIENKHMDDGRLSIPEGIYTTSPFIQRHRVPTGKRFNLCPWCGKKLI